MPSAQISSEDRINTHLIRRHIGALDKDKFKARVKIVSVADAARASNDAQRTTLRLGGSGPQTVTSDIPDNAADSDRRATLERELDRLQQTIHADTQIAGQHLNWLLLSQALFVNAFLVVLIVGRTLPMNYSLWLLCAIAVVGLFCAIVLHAALRRAGDELAMLRLQRRAIEMSLQSEFGRVPVFPPSRSESPSPALPAVFAVAWALLVAYGLFLA